MEIKKSPKADLERGKTLSFFLGLVLALAVVYVALEYRSSDAKEVLADQNFNLADIDNAPIIMDTQPEEPIEQPQTQETVEVQLPDDFKVVDDDKEVDKISFVSSDEDKVLPPPAPVAPPAPVKQEEADNTVFKVVEKEAEFPGGGRTALNKWLSRNVRYPQDAEEAGIKGTVILQFVIEKDGSVSDVKVVRSVDPQLDKEAVRAVKSMPKWSPAEQRGKPVRYLYTLPVDFIIQ